MPYEQVTKILDRAKNFHRDLSALYQRLEETAPQEDEIVRIILGYMKDHEKKLEMKLDAFENTATQNIKDTWFQFPPAEKLEVALDELRFCESMSVNDLVALSLRFDNALINFYREAAESAHADKVRDIFENLYHEGQYERRKLVSSIFGFE